MAFIGGQTLDKPLFVWAHYYDLHLPYRPRPDFDVKYPGNPYAAEAAFVDGQVGQLAAAIKADQGRNWRIVVVGDHGEGLGDHHEMGHGMALYRSTLHVPLIVWPKPERLLQHPQPWRLEDLDPTLRSWFGLPSATHVDGDDLFATGNAGRLLPALTIQPCVQFAVNPCLGIRKGSWMYMRHGVEELYDLAADPGETKDLAHDAAQKSMLAGLRADCDSLISLANLTKAAERTAKRNPAELQGLQGLGYIGIPVSNFGALQRADIRSVCDDESAIERAKKEFQRTNSPQPLRAAYESLLQKYPQAGGYLKDYGEFLIKLGDIDGAFRAFDRAVRLDPHDQASLANLGGLYLAKGQPEKAKVVFEAVLAINEADPVAHKNLGIIYAHYIKDPAKAVEHYKRYLEIAPDADAEMVRQYIRSVEQAGH
jgi:tetratricopeptide (TPR) repeat protein